jgi:hypothetical protein
MLVALAFNSGIHETLTPSEPAKSPTEPMLGNGLKLRVERRIDTQTPAIEIPLTVGSLEVLADFFAEVGGDDRLLERRGRRERLRIRGAPLFLGDVSLRPHPPKGRGAA